jgi:alpha-tubulin suppressor-like RCC1 family protein
VRLAWLVCLVLVPGCDDDGERPPDLTAPLEDLGMPPDLVLESDLAPPPDLAPEPDQAPLPDLAPCTSTVLDVSAGARASCAVRPDGTLFCWGANTVFGQLGYGNTMSSSSPAPVVGLGASVAEAQIGVYNACARKRDDSFFCWGANSYGELGNGSMASSPLPVPMSGIGASGKRIFAGQEVLCGIAADDSAWCLGSNQYGQLGLGLPTGASSGVGTPTSIVGFGAALRVSMDYAFVCWLKAGGAVVCAGRNDHGQLGDGNAGTDSNVPVPVSSLSSGVTALAVNDRRACALKGDQTVWCWGDLEHSGQVQDKPVQVSGLQTVTAIAVGLTHACAILADETVWCWGANDLGQLGQGDTQAYVGPVKVTALGQGAVQVSSGPEAQHTLVRKSDGSAWCWGQNLDGECTQPTASGQPAPVRVCLP